MTDELDLPSEHVWARYQRCLYQFPSSKRHKTVVNVPKVHTQRCVRKDGGKFAKATGEHSRKHNPQLPSLGLHLKGAPKHREDYNPSHSKETTVKIDRVGGGRNMSGDLNGGKGYQKKDHQGKPVWINHVAKTAHVYYQPEYQEKVRKSHDSSYVPSSKVLLRWTAKAARIVEAMPTIKKRKTVADKVGIEMATLLAGDTKDVAHYDKVDKQRAAQAANRILTETQRAAKTVRADAKQEAKDVVKPENRKVVKATTLSGKKARYARRMEMEARADEKRAIKIQLYKESLNV